MTRNEILQKIMEYLDLQVDGMMGKISQDPYRGEFFELFAEAYNQGLIANKALRANVLKDIFQNRWYEDSDDRNIDRIDFVEDFLMYWHAWEYAWEQHGKRHVTVGI